MLRCSRLLRTCRSAPINKSYTRNLSEPGIVLANTTLGDLLGNLHTKQISGENNSMADCQVASNFVYGQQLQSPPGGVFHDYNESLLRDVSGEEMLMERTASVLDEREPSKFDTQSLMEGLRCCVADHDAVDEVISEVFKIGLADLFKARTEDRIMMLRYEISRFSKVVNGFTAILDTARNHFQSAGLMPLGMDLVEVICTRYGFFPRDRAFADTSPVQEMALIRVYQACSGNANEVDFAFITSHVRDWLENIQSRLIMHLTSAVSSQGITENQKRLLEMMPINRRIYSITMDDDAPKPVNHRVASIARARNIQAEVWKGRDQEQYSHDMLHAGARAGTIVLRCACEECRADAVRRGGVPESLPAAQAAHECRIKSVLSFEAAPGNTASTCHGCFHSCRTL